MEPTFATILRDSDGAGNPTHDAPRASQAFRMGFPQMPMAGACRIHAPAFGGEGFPCWW